LRVVLDTQVWVRGALSKDPDAIGSVILRAARAGVFDCVGSVALVDEIARILEASHVAPKTTRDDAVAALQLAIALMQLVEIEGIVLGIEDPHDNHVLEAALVGKTELIVTHDGDFHDKLPAKVRDMLKCAGISVVLDSEFCGQLRAEPLMINVEVDRIAALPYLTLTQQNDHDDKWTARFVGLQTRKSKGEIETVDLAGEGDTPDAAAANLYDAWLTWIREQLENGVRIFPPKVHV